ncbi:MAG: hypothetical protein WC058_01490, partial [Phycisphaeraceae bacterium]
MAKMFYSIEEAAGKLGVSADQVKRLAEQGKLQQFRDRDKVMFKVDQVDKLAGKGAGGASGGDSDSLDLASETEADHSPRSKADTKGATGVSVFDADEIEVADPAAQTVVSSTAMGHDDDLALESVGSGSGLLDLTRESDDTSLGAELLEEIYPAGAAAGGSDAKVEGGSGFEGIFDAAGGVESAPSAFTEAPDTGSGAESPVAMTPAESPDPVGSGWTGGLLAGAIVAMILVFIVVVTGMSGVVAALVVAMSKNLNAYAGGLVVLTAIFAAIGLFIG